MTKEREIVEEIDVFISTNSCGKYQLLNNSSIDRENLTIENASFQHKTPSMKYTAQYEKFSSHMKSTFGSTQLNVNSEPQFLYSNNNFICYINNGEAHCIPIIRPILRTFYESTQSNGQKEYPKNYQNLQQQSLNDFNSADKTFKELSFMEKARQPWVNATITNYNAACVEDKRTDLTCLRKDKDISIEVCDHMKILKKNPSKKRLRIPSISGSSSKKIMEQEMLNILLKNQVMKFESLMNLLVDCKVIQLDTESEETVLKYLPIIANCIRGNWVLKSDVLYKIQRPEHISSDRLKQSRDYVLCQFYEGKTVLSKTVQSVTSLPSVETDEMLEAIAIRVQEHSKNAISEWKFYDHDYNFINNHTTINNSQIEIMSRKLSEITFLFSVKPTNELESRKRRLSTSSNNSIKSPLPKRSRSILNDVSIKSSPKKSEKPTTSSGLKSFLKINKKNNQTPISDVIPENTVTKPSQNSEVCDPDMSKEKSLVLKISTKSNSNMEQNEKECDTNTTVKQNNNLGVPKLIIKPLNCPKETEIESRINMVQEEKQTKQKTSQKETKSKLPKEVKENEIKSGTNLEQIKRKVPERVTKSRKSKEVDSKEMEVESIEEADNIRNEQPNNSNTTSRTIKNEQLYVYEMDFDEQTEESSPIIVKNEPTYENNQISNTSTNLPSVFPNHIVYNKMKHFLINESHKCILGNYQTAVNFLKMGAANDIDLKLDAYQDNVDKFLKICECFDYFFNNSKTELNFNATSVDIKWPTGLNEALEEQTLYVCHIDNAEVDLKILEKILELLQTGTFFLINDLKKSFMSDATLKQWLRMNKLQLTDKLKKFCRNINRKWYLKCSVEDGDDE